MPSAPLMHGTISEREPSLRSTSTAMPRFTGEFSVTCGLPSASP